MESDCPAARGQESEGCPSSALPARHPGLRSPPACLPAYLDAVGLLVVVQEDGLDQVADLVGRLPAGETESRQRRLSIGA